VHMEPEAGSETDGAVDAQIDRIASRLRAADIAVLWRDLTRPDLGVPVARVFAPGLAHYREHVRSPRLASVPVAMRWRDRDFGMADLLDLPLKI